MQETMTEQVADFNMQLAKQQSARQAAEVHLQALRAQLESVQCGVQGNTPAVGDPLEATGSAVVHQACSQAALSYSAVLLKSCTDGF